MNRLAIILYLLSGSVAWADCTVLVWEWTYTARGQTVCLFTHYDIDGSVRNRAHQCGTILPKKEMENAMTDGIRSFNSILQQVGKDQACEDMLGAFSDVVQR
jgi:hypothetical protein